MIWWDPNYDQIFLTRWGPPQDGPHIEQRINLHTVCMWSGLLKTLSCLPYININPIRYSVHHIVWWLANLIIITTIMMMMITTTIIVAYFIIYKCFTYYNPSTLHGIASGPAQLDLDMHPWIGPYMASDPRPDSILVPWPTTGRLDEKSSFILGYVIRERISLLVA